MDLVCADCGAAITVTPEVAAWLADFPVAVPLVCTPCVDAMISGVELPELRED